MLADAIRIRSGLSAMALLAAIFLAAGCSHRKPVYPSSAQPPPGFAESAPQEPLTSTDAEPSEAPPLPQFLPTQLAGVPLDGGSSEPRVADAPPASGGGIDERFLQAVLESQTAEMQQAGQRLSYPDDLPGGAIVKSARKPGQLTFFYPLRATGAVTVAIAKDRTVTLSPPTEASVKPIVDTLTRYLDAEGEKAAWYPARNMLEITVFEENMPFVLDLLNFLDAPQRQIIIEAAVWEVSKVQDTQLGTSIKVERQTGSSTFFEMFDSHFDTQAFLDTLISNQPFQGGTLEFVTAADAHGAKMDIVFQFLRNWGYADIVSRPRMRVSVGQTAKILTGEQVPIQSVKLLSDRFEIGAQTTYKDVGVQLYVTPTIATPDSVTVLLLPIVSEITGYSDPGLNGVSNPIIATREAQTEVTVANEELITIGGLDYTKRLTKETKIPILGDIPYLGLLFKSKREVHKEVQLWFTVKPTIADAGHRLILPELTGNPPAGPARPPLPK